jgi:hypothetical protein
MKIIPFLFALFVAALFAGCDQNPLQFSKEPLPGTGTARTTQPIILRASVVEPVKSQVVFIGADREENSAWELFNGCLTGLVTNNTSESIAGITAEFSLYDESGAKIGTTTDTVRNLAGHEVWRVKARVFEKEFKHYRFEGLTMQ